MQAIETDGAIYVVTLILYQPQDEYNVLMTLFTKQKVHSSMVH